MANSLGASHVPAHSESVTTVVLNNQSFPSTPPHGLCRTIVDSNKDFISKCFQLRQSCIAHMNILLSDSKVHVENSENDKFIFALLVLSLHLHILKWNSQSKISVYFNII